MSKFFPLGFIGSWFRREQISRPKLNPTIVSFITDRRQPVYVDVSQDLMNVYQNVPHLRAVIERRAEMYSNADIKLLNDMDEEVDDPILNLIRKPNPLQNQETFMYMDAIYDGIYSQGFIYKNRPLLSISVPKTLWNLPPNTMKMIPTGRIWDQTDIDGIIEKYVMYLGNNEGSERAFTPSEIIHLTQGVSDNYLSGISRIVSLAKAISNIDGALQTRNKIIQDRGALGILSSQSKDDSGGIPLGDTERENITRQTMKQYGIADEQQSTIITNAALSYQSMSFPTKDLMLFEEIEDDFNAICSCYGMARDLFPSTKGATFENQQQALKLTYQNTIQPFADLRMRTLSNHLGLTDRGLRLVADYSWLPALQEDELKEAQEEKVEADTAQVNVNTIILINDAIRSGKISREVATKMVSTMCDIDESEASSYISATYQPPTPPDHA